ncbi:uncharacterized protein [Amphiura filiformis]|uniref:uncharacterized protein n=1 Tax=Amphiura filiformis TaxID=82378 RepID=UPI003B227AA9
MPFVAWSVRTDLNTGTKQRSMLLKVARVYQPHVSFPSIGNRYTCPDGPNEAVSSKDAVSPAAGSNQKSRADTVNPCTRCNNRRSSGDDKVAGVKYHEDHVASSEDTNAHADRECIKAPQQYNEYEDRILPTINMSMNHASDNYFQSDMIRRAKSMRPGARKKKEDLHTNDASDKSSLKVLQGIGCNNKTNRGENDYEQRQSHTTDSVKCNNKTYISRSGRGQFTHASYTAPNTRIEFATPLSEPKQKEMNMAEWLKLMSLINNPYAENETFQARRGPIHIPVRMRDPELKQVLTNRKVDLHSKLPAVGGSLAVSKGLCTRRSIPCLGLERTSHATKTHGTTDMSLMTSRTVKSATF